MQPAQLLALLPPWLQLLVALGAVIGPVWIAVMKAIESWRTWHATARQQDELSFREINRQLMDNLRAEIARASAETDKARTVMGQYVTEIEILRNARWRADDMEMQLRDAAVSARAMVHEMERRIGLPLTVFPPLPVPPIARAPPAA